MYGGWFSGLLGGILIGAGISLLWVSRTLVEITERVGDPLAYADVQLWGVIVIFLGIVFGAIGIYAIYSSPKTLSPKPSVTVSVGKKYCRYCGTETKSDTVFCEKCGKKLTEG